LRTELICQPEKSACSLEKAAPGISEQNQRMSGRGRNMEVMNFTVAISQMGKLRPRSHNQLLAEPGLESQSPKSRAVLST
jgi:hypothetical protein